MRQKQVIKDSGLEHIMGVLLRTGVIISAAIVIIGAVFYLVQNGMSKADYINFHGEPKGLRNLNQIIHAAIHLKSEAIIQVGLLVLIATPVARVIFSVIGFYLEKDYLYVGITLLVLGVIVFSMLSGLAG